MTEDSRQILSHKQYAFLKFGILIIFIVSCIYVFKSTSIGNYLTPEVFGEFLASAGPWAPIVYILFYAVGVCFFIPGTLLTGLGVILFGFFMGFLYVWFGAMLGASSAFYLGRHLGRDFAAAVIGDKLKRYDDAIGRNGFAAVLYLRLVYFPFTAMNFGMGLTKVKFSDYFFGTGLGIIVGTFIFTYLIGTLKDVWASGNWSQLLSFRVFFSVGLFIFSLFIPKIVKRFKQIN
jgi:uncharacterized membrane protein YdjX (TVP38/TMEM64 family)